VLIERYPPSKYATAFLGGTVVGAGGDLFISPPSNYSGSSLSDPPDHPYHHSHHHSSSSNHHHSSSSNHLARSLSMPGHESEGGHTSYTSCSVHGTLRSQFLLIQLWVPFISVSDLDSLIPDPDPAF
jgi:hypothetical protein